MENCFPLVEFSFSFSFSFIFYVTFCSDLIFCILFLIRKPNFHFLFLFSRLFLILIAVQRFFFLFDFFFFILFSIYHSRVANKNYTNEDDKASFSNVFFVRRQKSLLCLFWIPSLHILKIVSAIKKISAGWSKKTKIRIPYSTSTSFSFYSLLFI